MSSKKVIVLFLLLSIYVAHTNGSWESKWMKAAKYFPDASKYFPKGAKYFPKGEKYFPDAAKYFPKAAAKYFSKVKRIADKHSDKIIAFMEALKAYRKVNAGKMTKEEMCKSFCEMSAKMLTGMNWYIYAAELAIDIYFDKNPTQMACQKVCTSFAEDETVYFETIYYE